MDNIEEYAKLHTMEFLKFLEKDYWLTSRKEPWRKAGTAMYFTTEDLYNEYLKILENENN